MKAAGQTCRTNIMKHYLKRAAKRRILSLRYGAANRPAAVDTLPAATIIPPHELRRLVASMVD